MKHGKITLHTGPRPQLVPTPSKELTYVQLAVLSDLHNRLERQAKEDKSPFDRSAYATQAAVLRRAIKLLCPKEDTPGEGAASEPPWWFLDLSKELPTPIPCWTGTTMSVPKGRR
jgi:hypothetical protein